MSLCDMTLCDRCAAEIPADEANDGPAGSEWDGAVLCNDCHAETAASLPPKETK
jgi:hypothetical protein